MKWKTLLLTAVPTIALTAGYAWLPKGSSVKQPQFWQALTSPGALSRGHQSLACNDCHAPVSGPHREKCVVCHANNRDLLTRQPTSFHAHIASCKECHTEHRGEDQAPTQMDHALLARLARRSLEATEASDEAQAVARSMAMLLSHGTSPHAEIDPESALLDCGSCHSNEDVHLGLFGEECQQCHGTDSWALPRFHHPSPRSKDCNQCHQAPPSHYMMHFKMVSAKVARKPHARVEDCFVCHETTSWNDIVDVGWYKHH